MAKIYGYSKGSNVRVVRSLRGQAGAGAASLFKQLDPTIRRFYQFFDLLETVQSHGYLQAAMSVIGRVGSYADLLFRGPKWEQVSYFFHHSATIQRMYGPRHQTGIRI